MLKFMIYVQKISENGQNWPPYLDSRFCVKRRRSKRYVATPLRFFNMCHAIFRINVKLNFALNLLIGFAKKISKKGWQPNSEISPEKFRIWPSN